jgi:hypothetical protein
VPLVKLTIRAEPVEVDDGELAVLRGQNLIDRVLDVIPPALPKTPPPGPVDPPVVPARAKPGPKKQEK